MSGLAFAKLGEACTICGASIGLLFGALPIAAFGFESCSRLRRAKNEIVERLLGSLLGHSWWDPM